MHTEMVNGQPPISFHGSREHVKGTGKYQATQE
jgi:hypothetical protein